MCYSRSAALTALFVATMSQQSRALIEGQAIVADRVRKYMRDDAPPVDVHAQAKEAYESVPPFIVVLLSMVTSGFIVLLALKIGAYISSPVPKGGATELEEALKEAQDKANVLAKQLQEEQQALRQAEIEERTALAAERAAQGLSEVQDVATDLQAAGASAMEAAKMANEKATVSIKLAMKAQEVLQAEMDCIRSRAETFAQDEKRGLVDKMNHVMETIQSQTPDSITGHLKAAADEAQSVELGEVVMVSFSVLSINFSKMKDAMKAELKAKIEAGIAAAIDGLSPGQVTASLRGGSVRVVARLEAPGGAEPLLASIKSSSTLKSTIIEQINTVPDIATMTFGALTVKSVSTITAKTGAEFQDGFELPPISTLIAGALAPSRLRSLHDSTLNAMLYHFIIALVGGLCLLIDWNVACTQERLEQWIIAMVAAQILCFLTAFLLRFWSARALGEMQDVASDLEETGQTAGIGGVSATEVMNLMQDFRKSFGPYSFAMRQYDGIVATWAYFFSRISGLILMIIGFIGVWIAINDVLLDYDFCNMTHVLKFADAYSFMFLFFLTWQLVWLVHWLLTVAVGCGATWATKFVITTAQSLDKDVPMNLPIFTSLAQSFVLRNSSQQFKLQEEQFEDEIGRLERKLSSLQDDLGVKQERMKVLDRLRADRKQLSNLDDPMALTANLKEAMAEVEPVVIFAASMTSDNLKDMSDAAAAAGEELQRAAAEAAAEAGITDAARAASEAAHRHAAAASESAQHHAAVATESAHRHAAVAAAFAAEQQQEASALAGVGQEALRAYSTEVQAAAEAAMAEAQAPDGQSRTGDDRDEVF